MSTDTKTPNLVINTLTQEQFDEIVNPSDTELYLTPDTTAEDIASAVSAHNSSASAHSDIRSAIAGKSTVSVSATGTATDEVGYITIDGVEKKLAGGSGGGSEEDNLSITKNASDKIQTVGVIDQNNTTTAIKTWTGTRAEYDAIANKNPNTLYNITDDSDLNLPILQTLYPVGSVYMTFNATCPLASLFGTWQKVGTKLLVDVNSTLPVVGDGNDIHLHTTSGGNANRDMTLKFTNTELLRIEPVIGTLADQTNTNPVYFGDLSNKNIGLIADLSSAKTEMTINIFRRTA